jgi:acyl carrier protein phosphodiesterase
VNWLAHLRLSPPQPLLRLGNLAGDFVAGVELATLPAELQRGIALHRAIDRFVDAHPVVVAAKARLVPPHRRFAGVLLDVWFDHFLARDWAQHGDGRPLPLFLADVHQDLRTHHALLPAPLQRVAPRFCAAGWLAGYASVDGIARVLGLMARRMSRPTPLADGAELLRADYTAVERDFKALWPELVAFSAAGAPA